MDRFRFRFVLGLAVLLSTAWVAQASTPSNNSNKQSGNSSQVSQANEEAFPNWANQPELMRDMKQHRTESNKPQQPRN